MFRPFAKQLIRIMSPGGFISPTKSSLQKLIVWLAPESQMTTNLAAGFTLTVVGSTVVGSKRLAM
jgi:hypothetical protein